MRRAMAAAVAAVPAAGVMVGGAMIWQSQARAKAKRGRAARHRRTTGGVATWQWDSMVFELEPTPEPATLLLFGSTLGALGIFRKVQRRKRDGSRSRRVVD